MVKDFLKKKHIFVPQDHGSWVFIFSPIIIGLFILGHFRLEELGIVLGSITFFLFRQPLTAIIKMLSGRRDNRDMYLAVVWVGIYGILFLASLGIVLFYQQYYFIQGMAFPAIIMMGWQFVLVAKRNERRQKIFEALSTGLLSFIAPALFWVHNPPFDRIGLILWLLIALQSIASIFYAYTRLEQRVWTENKPVLERLKVSATTIGITLFNLVFCYFLGQFNLVSTFLWIAFSFQFIETSISVIKPAIGVKPTIIGFRQTVVSVLFLVTFIYLW